MKVLLKSVGALLLAAPLAASAQRQIGIGTKPNTFGELVGLFISIINALIPIVIGIAVIIFFWGIVKYVASPDEDAKEKGRDLMVWGSLAFFVMISVFGIISIIARTFGVPLR